MHTAGVTSRGFRVFEVWESRESYDRLVEQRLMPIVKEVAPSDARPPELTIYELHGFVVAPEAAAATGLGLKEAKALVDEAPKAIREGIEREEAGGSVELK